MSEQINRNVCGVCGDSSTGRNFGAFTCESCKVFFRRIHAKNKTLPKECRFKSKCVITETNRRYCQKCRLDKCLEIGMRKELLAHRQDITSDKPKKTITSSTSSSAENSDESTTHSSNDSSDPSSDTLQDLDFIIDNSRVTDDDLSDGIRLIEDLLTEPSEQIMCSLVPVVRPIATFDKPFNELELHRLQELMTASNHYRGPDRYHETKYLFEIRTIASMYEILSNFGAFDQTLYSTINFCKSLSLFSGICEEDKIALFKGCCFKLVAIKFLPLSKFDKQLECYTYPVDNENALRCHLSAFRDISENAFESSKIFWEYITTEWIQDPIIINLLLAIVLFRSDNTILTHKNAVKLHQQMYFYLLQRYLIQKFRSDNRCQDNLSKLMNCLQVLHFLYELEVTVAKGHLELFGPLIRETYDL